jgi:hypothetical protein
VTVGAHHLTASDLGLDGLARGSLREQHGDARGLLADVVELEDQRIGVAAVDAWVVRRCSRICALSARWRAFLAAYDWRRWVSPRSRKYAAKHERHHHCKPSPSRLKHSVGS